MDNTIREIIDNGIEIQFHKECGIHLVKLRKYYDRKDRQTINTERILTDNNWLFLKDILIGMHEELKYYENKQNTEIIKRYDND